MDLLIALALVVAYVSMIAFCLGLWGDELNPKNPTDYCLFMLVMAFLWPAGLPIIGMFKLGDWIERRFFRS